MMRQINQNPVTSIVLVTPEMASAWLAKAHRNRPLKQKLILHLLGDMESGNWRVTHQGIALDWDDRLVDGQHRLTAVVRFGRPVPMMVTMGVDFEASMAAIDQGKIRTSADMLNMMGEPNATTKAAMSRTIRILTSKEQHYSTRVSQADIRTALENWRDEINFVCELGTNCSGVRLLAANLAPIAINHRQYPGSTEQILLELTKGENLASGSPTLALRNWMISTRRSSEGNRTFLALLMKQITCLDVYNHGEKTGTLKAGASRYVRWCRSVGIDANQSLLLSLSTER